MTEERANSNFKVLVTQIHIKSIEEYLFNIIDTYEIFIKTDDNNLIFLKALIMKNPARFLHFLHFYLLTNL